MHLPDHAENSEATRAAPVAATNVVDSVSRGQSALWLAILLAIGLALRAVLSYATGYQADLKWFASWLAIVTNTGLEGIYSNSDVNYPPLFIFVLRLMGELWQQIDATFAKSDNFFAFLRLPAVLADVGIALLLHSEVRRLAGRGWALAAAAMYFLNPAVFYVTAIWGQVDSIHTMFVLAALVATNRHRFAFAGFFAAVSVAMKLQSIAFLPLFVFEAFRLRSWRGLRDFLAGGVLGALLIILPLAQTGTIEQAYQRGYKNVVGQYPKRSIEAFNLWYLLDQQDAPDDVPPTSLLRLAAVGGPEVADDAAWYLWFTYRKLSILAFGLVSMLAIAWLPLWSRHDARALVAALIGLAFFTLLTEMHERYAFPVLALLVLWAACSPVRQTAYWLCSSFILMNLVHVLGTEQIKTYLGGAAVVLLFVFLAWMIVRPRLTVLSNDALDAALADPVLAPSRVVSGYQLVAVGAGVFATVVGTAVWWSSTKVPVPQGTNVVYLSDLEPTVARNGWRELVQDRSVAGGPLYLSGRYYLKGLGTHAPATVEYAIPTNAESFQAIVEVNRASPGRVVCRVFVDDVLSWESAELARRDPATVELYVAGAETLRLEVDPLRSMRHDHVDWALARFVLVDTENDESVREANDS